MTVIIEMAKQPNPPMVGATKKILIFWSSKMALDQFPNTFVVKNLTHISACFSESIHILSATLFV